MKVIIVRGPLGVGKSTVSKMLAKEIHAKYISLDKILKENELEGKDGISVENFIRANEIIINSIKDTSKPIIIDGCFYYQEQIDDIKKRSKDVQIFTITSTLNKCIERDANRKNPLGKASAEYVYMITTKIKAGIEIDNTDLSVKETTEIILDKIKL